MIRVLLPLLMIIGIFAQAESADVAPIEVLKYTFKLHSFTIDTSQSYTSGKKITCSESELEEGVRGFVTPLDKKVDPKVHQRHLVPSFHPRLGLAAWQIFTPQNRSKPGCPDLLPHFNGIGLSSFDVRSGRATVYLAAFVPSKRSDILWRAQKDAVVRLGMLFNPELQVVNLTSFPAQCALNVNSRALVFVLGGYMPAAEMVCTLDGEKGEVRLIAEYADESQIPPALLKNLTSHQGLLHGEVQQPTPQP